MAVFALALSVLTPAAEAVEVQDIVRVKGLERNELIGMGLVTGLDGTGDKTKKSARLARPLFELYRKFGMGVESLDELQGIDSVAVVMVTGRLAATGAREGDRFDLEVSVVGDASDLTGGQLIQTFLKAGVNGEPFAFASGFLEVDPRTPRRGIVRGGGQMLRDVRVNPLNPADGTITLVINDEMAGYPVAEAIASRITQEFAIDAMTYGEVWARAVDPSNVVLHLAPGQQRDPSALLSQVLTLDIDAALLQVPARVTINRQAGTILVSGDVEISPVIITSRGLTITQITPEPAPTPDNPVYATRNHVAVESTFHPNPANAGRLQDLLQALESLKVPFEDRVAILREMHKMGVLHAQLIDEGA